MNRPLYAAAADEPAHREPAGHAGLWFDKFCNTWRRDGGAWTMKEDKERRERGADGNPKLEWLRTLVDGPVGAQEQIDEYALRIVRLVERRGGLAVVFKTDARFVTGLGRSHPVENGFAWHPTLGTPCLPGSSVKGMVRAWVDADPDPRPGAEETRDRLLGTPGRAGRLCFLDAVPTVPVRLDADVMTPHFAGWSAGDPPGDWRTPTPIPFLVTAAETRFLFGVLPVQPLGDGDLSTVEIWLRDALAWAGAGAKTAVGYGRFGRDDEKRRPVGSGESVTKIAGAKRNGSDRKQCAPRKGGGAWSSRDCRRPKSSTRCEYIWRKNRWRMPATGAPSPTLSARWTSSGTGATAARRTPGPGSAGRSSKNGYGSSTTRPMSNIPSGPETASSRIFDVVNAPVRVCQGRPVGRN